MTLIDRVYSIRQAIDALQKDKGGIYIEDDPSRAGLETRIFCGSVEIFGQLRKILKSENSLMYASDVFVVFVNTTVEEVEKLLRNVVS